MTVVLPILIIVLLYLSACIVHIHQLKHNIRELLSQPNSDFAHKAQVAIAILWECHGRIWHGYEVEGLNNLPKDKRALVVYYHGAIPVDYYYLNAKYRILNKRIMRTIAANFLFKTPGLRAMMDVLQATPGTVKLIADLLNDEQIVSVSPGGIREAQFSTEYYELLWNGHIGFAKAACLGKAPIIPVFTPNIREAYRTMPFFRSIFRKIYETTKLPLLSVYGGFPVKLKTIIGEPIPYDEKATPEEVAMKSAEALEALIKKHQRLPGSITAALLDRFK